MKRGPVRLRCVMCARIGTHPFEPTQPPIPSGWRCTDHDACRQRVRDIVAAHVGLGEVCR